MLKMRSFSPIRSSSFRRWQFHLAGFTCLAILPLLSLANNMSSTVNELHVTTHSLSSNSLNFVMTPEIGGRGLVFSAPGKANVLRLGSAIGQKPNTVTSINDEFRPYFGHIVWLGPQSEWWTHQDMNQQRRDTASSWPPDSYTAFANTTVTKQTGRHIHIEGVDSPVSGTRLSKQFTLSEDGKELRLSAYAVNIREDSIAWDIWFNTRVLASAVVYVPVAGEQNAYIMNRFGGSGSPASYTLKDGFLILRNQGVLNPGVTRRQEKIGIQPSAGWMAAFIKEQLFIIEFDLLEKPAIHPNQGQIELYFDFWSEKPAEGVIELEVHGPYKTIESGEAITASETWRIMPYDGAATVTDQIQFLKQQLKGAGYN